MGSNFDPALMYKHFKESLREDAAEPDVSIKEYLEAYEQIIKFLELLGAVFRFVISDIKEKQQQMGEYMQAHPSEYATLLSMIKYEKDVKHCFDKKPVKVAYCTRHFLRLH